MLLSIGTSTRHSKLDSSIGLQFSKNYKLGNFEIKLTLLGTSNAIKIGGGDSK